MPTVLITGANRGLGLEFARQYAADGWTVYAACREPHAASRLAQIARSGAAAGRGATPGRRKTAQPGRAAAAGEGSGRGTLSILQLDVTDARSIEQAGRTVREPIDVLINGAGIMGGSQAFGRMDYGAWEAVLRVNTLGPMRVSEALADQIARSDRRLIVTITSGLGSIADNTSGGWIAYRSSKTAVNMVMRSLAVELAPRRIICLAVSPGWVQTDMGGPGAPLTAAESVGAMRRLFDRLGPDDSGKFFGHDGRSIPW